jgi:hypothetical protein
MIETLPIYIVVFIHRMTIATEESSHTMKKNQIICSNP